MVTWQELRDKWSKRLFSPRIDHEGLRRLFPCCYCGQPKHETYEEGYKCMIEHGNREIS